MAFVVQLAVLAGEPTQTPAAGIRWDSDRLPPRSLSGLPCASVLPPRQPATPTPWRRPLAASAYGFAETLPREPLSGFWSDEPGRAPLSR